MSISSSWVTSLLVVHSKSLRACLICIYVFVCVFVYVYKFNRHWHTTVNKSGCSCIGAFANKQDFFFDPPEWTNLLVAHSSQVSPCWTIGFWFCLDLLGVFAASANSEPNSLLHSSFKSSRYTVVLAVYHHHVPQNLSLKVLPLGNTTVAWCVSRRTLLRTKNPGWSTDARGTGTKVDHLVRRRWKDALVTMLTWESSTADIIRHTISHFCGLCCNLLQEATMWLVELGVGSGFGVGVSAQIDEPFLSQLPLINKRYHHLPQHPEDQSIYCSSGRCPPSCPKTPQSQSLAAWQHGIDVWLHAEVRVTLRVALGRSVEGSAGLNASETGKKNTRVTETFGAEKDDVCLEAQRSESCQTTASRSLQIKVCLHRFYTCMLGTFRIRGRIGLILWSRCCRQNAGIWSQSWYNEKCKGVHCTSNCFPIRCQLWSFAVFSTIMKIRVLKQSLWSNRNARVSSKSCTVTNRSKSWTYTCASSFVCTAHFRSLPS